MKKLFTLLFILTNFLCYSQSKKYDGLVAYYPLDGDANDYSDSLNHGTINGATVSTGVNGQPNSCFDFTTGNIEIDNIIILPKSELTLSVWVYVNDFNYIYKHDILSLYNGNNIEPSVDFSIDIYEVPMISCTLSTQDYWYGTWNLVPDFTFNQWHHILFEYDSKSSSLFLDGSLVITDNEAKPYTNGNAQFDKGFIGNTFGNFNGKIDELMIFNRRLTQTEKDALSSNPILSTSPQVSDNISVVYPSIVTNDLTINKNESDLVVITNPNGEVVYSGYESKIRMSQLPSGLYFAHISSTSKVFKIIKQ